MIVLRITAEDLIQQLALGQRLPPQDVDVAFEVQQSVELRRIGMLDVFSDSESSVASS